MSCSGCATTGAATPCSACTTSPAEPLEIRLSTGIAGEPGRLLVDILTDRRAEAEKDGRHSILMEGCGYHWYRVGGRDALLRRSRS